jgi:hypothetical protein
VSHNESNAFEALEMLGDADVAVCDGDACAVPPLPPEPSEPSERDHADTAH